MEIKSPSSSDLFQLEEFLKKQLRPSQKWKISNEFPIAFSQLNLKNIKFLSDDSGEIVSHALSKYVHIRTPSGLFKVCTIGSVCTHEDHKNKGYSSQLLKDQLSVAKKERCDIAILWSSLDGFYEKFGFTLTGREERVLIHSADKSISLKSNTKFIQNQKMSPEALLKLYNNHTVNSLRNLREVELYLNIPDSNTYSLWNDANELLAYAIVGRGLDMKNTIHEWGGDTDHLVQLISKIIESNTENLQIIMGSQSQNILKSLKTNFKTEHQTTPLGFIKVLNPETLHSKFLRWARFNKVYNIQFFSNDGQFYISHDKATYEIPGESVYCDMIFGNYDFSSLAPINKELAEALQALLPLPFWVWGWDIA